MLLETIKEEYIFNCQCRKLSDKTIKNYEKQIEYLLRFLEQEKGVTEIEGVKPQYIKEFLMKMKQAGRTVNYFNDLLKAFKVFFRYAYEEGYVETLLTEKIKNAKGGKVIIRTFSDTEIKRMMSHYQGHDFLNIRDKVMLLTLIDTGIRLSELISLTETQIKHNYIIIHGKGNKERVVPKSPLLGKWLIKYLSVRQAYFQYRIVPDNIFLSKNGKKLCTARVDRIIKGAGTACGVSEDIRVSAHTFRHTYAQYQLKNGLDIYTLSRLLGHESIAITQTYLNGIRDEEVLEQAQKTSPLMNL
ncbi:MAG: tyrosine-type recombinase/integrase [Oscillospiraceae bacterium]|nr:tyrosine-type recombinase/integrase [Oscillospiraceae bacterium]